MASVLHNIINGSDGVDDTLYDTDLDDELNGFGGNDSLIGSLGNDTLNGGAGDDYFFDWAGTNTFDGGEGNDHFYLSTLFPPPLGWSGDQRVTGGAGSDDFRLSYYPFPDPLMGPPPQVVITDFTVGIGGDWLSVSDYSYDLAGYGNPFDPALGFLAFSQVGPDAVLLFDYDGAAGPQSWVSIATLQGVTATDLVEDINIGYASFVLGGSGTAPVVHAPVSAYILSGVTFSFDGANAINITDFDAGTSLEQVDLSVSHGLLTLASTEGLTFTVGDGSADTAMRFSGLLADINAALATATYSPDSGYTGADHVAIQAFDGTATAVASITLMVTSSATISGDDNNNTLFGTEGAEVIFGLGGFDVLYGNGGDDYLDGGAGYNQLHGGDGDDVLVTTGGYGDLYGESGNDTLIGGDWGSNLDGGSGDDRLVGGEGFNSFSDSEGANVFVGGPNGNYFSLDVWNADLQVTAGAGVDTLGVAYFGWWNPWTAVVSGFTPGSGGDLLNFNDFMDDAAANGYYTAGNPFGLGYLRLQAAGDDTLVQGDLDGASGSFYDWQTLCILKNVATTSIVDANIDPANLYPLDGHTDPGIDWTGTGFSDYKNGTTLDDYLRGENGNDYLYGFGGNDTLDGGADADYLTDGPGDDLLVGGQGDDYLYAESGDDVLQGGDGNDNLHAYWGSNVLDGGAGDDLISVYSRDGMQTVTGGPGSDTFTYLVAYNGNYASITDFTPGAGGDILDFDLFLKYYASGYDKGDPFGSLGYLRFQESAGDTLVQADYSGAADGEQWRTVAVLQGVHPAAITTENVQGGYYTPVHAPRAADYGVTMAAGADHVFTAGEFGYYDNQDHPLDHLVVVTVPVHGNLYLDSNSSGSMDPGEAVPPGTTVAAAEIGHLTFEPASGESGAPYASFDFKVNDGVVDSSQAYTLTFNVFSESAVPTGDGNGDGVADDTQPNVESFQAAVQTAPGTPVVWATLAAPGGTMISHTTIEPVPADAPVTARLPYGMFSFDLAVPAPGISETLSIYLTGDWQMVGDGDFRDLDTGSQVNGYWKKGADGIWHNVARLITTDHGKLRIDFTLTDGDPRTDSDGVANGIIVDPGAAGFMPAPQLLEPPAVLPAGKEDTAYTVSTTQLLEGWSDADSEVISVIGLSADHGSVVDHGDGTYDIVPVADYNGPVILSYQVSDGTLATGATLGFQLEAVNDAPSFTAGANQTVPFGSGAQTIPAWASNLRAGPTDESGQTLSFTVLNDNAALFAVPPVIDAGGQLSYTPAAGGSGSATLTVTLQDDGGTANGGDDRSNPAVFTITVEESLNTPIGQVNDGNPANNAVAENSPNGTTVGITATAIDVDASDTVSYSLSNDAGGRFTIHPGSGVVTVSDGSQLDYEAQSSHTITVLATSSDGTSSHQNFTIDLLDVVEPTQTIKIGDAPAQLLRSAPKAWLDAWTNSAVSLAISHKANYANGAEAWSAVTLDGLNGGVLGGGDLFGGDLGVSGQSATTSATKQEIDGSEALRFAVAPGVHAGTATLKLARFYANDDGSGYREAGRLQAFKGGELVGEISFTADNAAGTKQVELSVPFGFDTLVLTSGAYDGDGHFVAGAYAQADGSYGRAPYSNASGAHGSDFLVDVLLLGIAPFALEEV
ncbi:MAG: cadherin-like domain-containing protein [Candidatus Accumulibacter cognatus]|uniref:Cadherin-like domain-containing protein n=1 Tax=Candidatus Accumulibacter cognatus TaxID=2954383 RepID=A0A7D5SB84_9PROT|nr:MAG: cadherin-like domain-containing protein [Candidatus Accumulibacter cognatus]